jgi:hypothetical protein
VDSGKVVYLNERRSADTAREFAVLFRLAGDAQAQFKVFGSELSLDDKAGLATAMEAAARTLRED